MAFERNQGQADPPVQFVMHNSSMAMLLTDSGATLRFAVNPATNPAETNRERRQLRNTVIAIEFKGAGTRKLVGERQLRGRSNYLIGNDLTRWVCDVPRYERVRYPGLYRGIDASIYANGGDVEYDFVVSPGGNPADVRLGFNGVERIQLDRNGDVLLKTAIGDVRQRKPAAYQQAGNKKISVDVHYAITGREVSIVVGSYDRSKELVIDPILVYATLLGGAGYGGASSVAVDAAGAAYIAGSTSSLNLPTTAGALQPHSGGAEVDAFLAKLNPQGTDVEYMTYLGGAGFDFGNAVAIDGVGNAYIAGRTSSLGFPGTFLTNSGNLSSLPPGVTVTQAFVTKINPAGSGIVYSVRFGGNDISQFPIGPNGTEANAIAVDPSGNAYVTGMTGAFEFPVTKPIVTGSPSCNHYGICTSFVTKINAAGTALVYSSLLGGGQGSAIAVDENGNAFVAGRWGPPPTPSAVQSDIDGAFSVGFVSKINPSGTALVYSAVLGGRDQAFCKGIAIDRDGNAYVTGSTTNADFPTTEGAFLRTKGVADFVPFVSKLNPTGTELLYSTFLISSSTLSESSAKSIALDRFGNAYVVGETGASTLSVTADAVQNTPQGSAANPYLLKLNSSGSGLLFATYFGGTPNQCCNTGANGVALDALGNAYMVGATSATDFPATPGTFETTLPEQTANFVAKFGVAADFGLSASPQSATVPRGGAAIYEVTVTPKYGFDGQVNLSCSGLPAGASCSFTPPAVSAGSTASSTLTIMTSMTWTSSASSLGISWYPRILAVLMLPFFGTVLLGGSFISKEARKGWWLSAAIISLSVLLACGGGVTKSSQSPGPSPSPSPNPGPTGSYQILVTGASAMSSLQHSATVQLNIQ